MANAAVAGPRTCRLVSLSFLVIVYLISGADLSMVNGEEQQKTWCVAKPSSDSGVLRDNIDYVCEQQGVDCEVIQPGRSCFDPDCAINHASVAMNLYYQSRGRHPWNCVFKDSGLIVSTDPSYNDCHYNYA